MIKQYVSDLATLMGMNPPKVSLVDGKSLGCKDTHLVNISSKGRIVGSLVFRTDLEKLANGVECDRLEVRIRLALSRLQVLLDCL